MPRKNGYIFPIDDDAAVALSAGLSRVVSGLLAQTAYSQVSFSKAIGYSRVTLNQVLKSTDGRYLWRLPMLCAVSRVLGIPVFKLVQAADPQTKNTELYLELAKHLDSAPKPTGGVAGLQDLIVRMLNSYYGVFPGEAGKAPRDRADYETAYRCSPVEIEQGCPEFYKAYMNGELTEGAASTAIWTAIQYASDHGGLDSLPLWVALRATYQAHGA